VIRNFGKKLSYSLKATKENQNLIVKCNDENMNPLELHKNLFPTNLKPTISGVIEKIKKINKN